MRQLCPSVLLKRELYNKAKVSVFGSVFVPILTYDHECWIINERMGSRVLAAEMGFLRNDSSLSLLNKVKITDIGESVNIEPLLPRIQRLLLRWHGHVTRMSHEQTAQQLMEWSLSRPFSTLLSGKRPRERLKTRWWNYVKELAWSRVGIAWVNCRELQESGRQEIPTRGAAPNMIIFFLTAPW